MTPVLDLLPIWTGILAIAVFFYVALDGFDLGVGILKSWATLRPAAKWVCRNDERGNRDRRKPPLSVRA